MHELQIIISASEADIEDVEDVQVSFDSSFDLRSGLG
jgi:hypothetical protein